MNLQFIASNTVTINNPEDPELKRPCSTDTKDCPSEQTNCSDQQLQETISGEHFNPQHRCWQESNKLKSQLCRKFMQYGYCPYEERCTFAHGPEELKQNQTPNLKYKTKRCFAFFRDGYCRFGERCNYLHRSEQGGTYNETIQQERRKKWMEIMKHNRHLVYQSKLKSRLPSDWNSEFL